MKTLVFALLLCTPLAAADVDAADKWQKCDSPNKRYTVRLHEGWAIGNCEFDQAQLVDVKTSKVLFDFDADEDVVGGYEKDSVAWSPNSRFVAVYKRHHRYGQPLVVRISDRTAKNCKFPEISLPHEKDPASAGRPAQVWQQPIKWLTETTLHVEVSGRIDQIPNGPLWIEYVYDVHIKFDKEGKGEVHMIKLRSFDKELGIDEGLDAPLSDSEQPGAGQPATRPVDEPEGSIKPQPEAEGRSR